MKRLIFGVCRGACNLQFVEEVQENTNVVAKKEKEERKTKREKEERI